MRREPDDARAAGSNRRRGAHADAPVVGETLAALVREILGAPRTAEVNTERIGSRVYRLRCPLAGTRYSFVGKRLDPVVARRDELVARRWLPAVGLAAAAPPLLCARAESDASAVWHLYEDLGDCGLELRADGGRLAAAVGVIAGIHTRFARHALIAEVRLWGTDAGVHFYESSVRDALRSVEALRARGSALDARQSSLCDRLLDRLGKLLDERPLRAAAMLRHGGPETLLHGDLWPMNVMAPAGAAPPGIRLIDWDHVAVGPVAYDLSTFLSRLPVGDRGPALELYEQAIAAAGLSLPPGQELNHLFETAELGRIANRVIWPALAAAEDRAGWAFDRLAEVERWFAALTPVLPLERRCG